MEILLKVFLEIKLEVLSQKKLLNVLIEMMKDVVEDGSGVEAKTIEYSNCW